MATNFSARDFSASNPKVTSARGFTLVETIITLMIMSILTLMSARTIQQAFRAKTKIQTQLDQVGQVKDTLRMLERDVNLAYHYLDLEKELAEELNNAQKRARTGAPGGRAAPGGRDGRMDQQAPSQPGFPPGAQAPNPFLKTENRVDPTTHFVAKENELNFVTLNTIRLTKDAPHADFGEVGYSVDSCKNRPTKKFESSKCLFRRFSPIVDRDVTQGGTKTQLVADVTEFKLRYYSRVQKDWRNDWNSQSQGGDVNTMDRYPEAIEVNLTVEPPIKADDPKSKKKKISLQMVIPIHFPNNKEPSNDSENPASAPFQ